MAIIRPVLGTMNFGGNVSQSQAHSILKKWLEKGYSEIDTAIRYHNGKTEKIIGSCEEVTNNEKVRLQCKVNPEQGFSASDVVNQFNASLASLRVSSVDILYLHSPDDVTPIEHTLEGIQQLYEEGKFKEFGLCNYAAWETAEVFNICRWNNFVLPTVYQGMYNPLTRDCEVELFPCVRHFGMRFYAYNILAGGLMSGKYDFSMPDEKQPLGRFFTNTNIGWQNQRVGRYRERFWRDSLKTAVRRIEQVLKQQESSDRSSILETSIRWLVYHSRLRADDGVILGFSRIEHFYENLPALELGPLSSEVSGVFEEVWGAIGSDCPSYFSYM